MPAATSGIEGKKFHRLTALRFSGWRMHGKRLWFFVCDCGRKITVPPNAVISGNTKSCGCLAREGAASRASIRNYKHGCRHTPEYAAWKAMRERCDKPTHPAYHNYGGRGISVSPRWRTFANFIGDMGRKPAPHFELDRINNDGNYEPGNCRWTTRSENIKNCRPRQRNNLGQFA